MRRLRYQLIGILLLVALLPAIPAGVTVRELFRRSLAGGAEEVVLKGARAGLDTARELLNLEKNAFARRIEAHAVVDTLTAEAMVQLDSGERLSLETVLRMADGSGGPDGEGIILAGPDRVRLGERELLAALVRQPDGQSVWVTTPLPDALVERAGSLVEAVRLTETLRRDRETVVRSLVLTFLTVYGGILVLVVILALLLASRLTRPLEVLGEGIDRVGAGDLETRVDVTRAGHLSRLVEQFNRMTERLKNQQDDLIRLEKLAAWRSLARRLAHEIKNPLTPIQLAAQQMRDSYTGEDPDHRHTLDDGAEIVEEEVRSLRTLVQEFSEFARLPEPRLRGVPLAEMLDDITALYGADRVSYRLQGGADELTAHCDPDEIHRVLINLVNNGMQAQEETARSEPIEILGWRADASVVVEVRDRGPGVNPERRRRIFSPDYSTKTEGMGLGLSIVEAIVRAHQGSIEVTAREGGGAVFRFDLPAREADGGGDSR
jgi:two-component system nitrogen regulation sensor histidine kinase NtrY